MRKISITEEIEKLVADEYRDTIRSSDINRKITDDLAALRQVFLNARRIEINTGSPKCKIDPDGWTARTVDGGLSAQWEHTLGITEDGVIIFTEKMV